MTQNLRKHQVHWSTTFPAIVDQEFVLVDTSAKPQPGNIILIRDKSNTSTPITPALVVHLFIGKHITKKDNSPLSYPISAKEIVGVVIGKSATIPHNFLASLLLNLFVLYSGFASIFRFKKGERFLQLIAHYFAFEELIQYNHKHDNTRINQLIFSHQQPVEINPYTIRKISQNRIILITKTLSNTELYQKEQHTRQALLHELTIMKKELKKKKIQFTIIKGGSYPFERDMSDIDLVTNEFSKVAMILKSHGYKETVIMKNESHFEKGNLCFDVHKRFPSISFSFDFPIKTKLNLSPAEQLLLSCTHAFKQRQFFLRDIYDVIQLTKNVNLNQIRIPDQGTYDLLGGPLIIAHLLDKAHNNTQYKDLESFVTKNYQKETKQIHNYLKERNFEFPISLYHLYKQQEIFRLYKYLKRPAEFIPHPKDNLIIKLSKSILVKIRTSSIKHYALKRLKIS